MHPSLRKRRAENSSGEEGEGRSRGRLTDGLSEWIIDRGLLTDAASINSSKALWWITADKQCWVSKCVFNKARWRGYCFFSGLQTETVLTLVLLGCMRGHSQSRTLKQPDISVSVSFDFPACTLCIFVLFFILLIMESSFFSALCSWASEVWHLAFHHTFFIYLQDE